MGADAKPFTGTSNFPFTSCTALTTVTMPIAVCSNSAYFHYMFGGTNVATAAWDNLENITVLDSPSTGSFPLYLFAGCPSISALTMPFVGLKNPLPSWGKEPLFGALFSGTTNTGNAPENYYKVIQDYYSTSIAAQNGTVTESYYFVPSNLKTVTVMGGAIGPYAFMNFEKLNTIVLSQNVTSIGYNAF